VYVTSEFGGDIGHLFQTIEGKHIGYRLQFDDMDGAWYPTLDLQKILEWNTKERNDLSTLTIVA